MGGKLFLSSGSCIFVCPSGTYQNSTSNTCITCDISCSICIGPLNTQCSSCSNATVNGKIVIYYLGIGQTTCLTYCPNGQYIDSKYPNLCQPCSSTCVTCQSDSVTCTSCPAGYYYYLSSCVSVCPSGTYGDQMNWICMTCDTSCLLCSGPLTTECTSCSNITIGGILKIYYLSIGQTSCSSSCPSGQYIDANISNFCQSCNINCATC